MALKERERAILTFLQEKGEGTVEELCRHLFVSEPTVRRDLAALNEKGLLIRTHGGARARDAVAVAADYITAHYAEPIKNARLGELTGYHEYYLNRLFLARMGMSIHKYVLSLRLDEARKLLENTALPLSRIATAVGFGTCAHFTAYFKKEFGIPPSRYREAAKQKGADAPIHP